MVKQVRPHYIKPNDNTARPCEHLFFDIESTLTTTTPTVTEHTLKMGWCCYWRRSPQENRDTTEYTFFTAGDQLIEIIESYARPKNPLLLIAHNVAYDAGVLKLFALFYAHGWTMSSFYASGMTVIIVFLKGSLKVKIMDNGNYFKTPLAKLGETLDLPKLDIDIELSPWDEMKSYCKRDVEIMVQAWREYYDFLDLHDFGRWGHTIPSQSWNAWRHRFMKEQVLIHGNDVAYQFERAAYHGGRTSVFYQGMRKGEPFYYVDVNSMYPAMMQDNQYPTVLVDIKKTATLKDLFTSMNDYACVAEVEIDTDEPVFPVAYHGVNVYPVGRFWTTLTTPELDYALTHMMIVDVRTVITYRQAPIFQEYVNYLYPLKVQYKQEGNEPYYMLTKLFQNSLYGRFGMKGHKWTKLPDDVPERDDIMMYVETTTGKRTKLYHYGSDVWTSEETGETENSFPAVAAHVTAYARLHLWSLCQKAGKGHYLYCDTDSLIVDATGYANLADEMDDIALGRLKVEQQATEIEILAPKFYRFGEGWKRKGVSKNAVQTDKQTFLSEVFPSFLTQGHWEPDQCFTTHKVTKRFSLKVTDGTRDEQGWIQPITITEMQDVEPVSSILPFDYMIKQDEIRALKDMRRIPPQVLSQLWDYTKGRYKNARNNQGDLVPLEYSKWDGLAPDIGFNNATDLMKGVHRELKLNRDIRDAQYQLNLIDQNPTRPPTPAN